MANWKTPQQRRKKTGAKAEEDRIQLEEDLALFDQFRKEIAPALRKDLLSGMAPEEIAKKYSSHAMARAVTIALSERDAGKALSAAKDVLDRTLGKSIERKQIKHEMSDLSDEQLDALINTAIKDESEDGETKIS